VKKSSSALVVLLFLSFVLVSLPQNGVVKAEPKKIVVPDDYQTISWAIGNATEGDTVFVKSGVYNETLLIDKPLSLIGENQATTIINGRNRGSVVYICKDGVNVTGFTILNGDTTGTPSPFFPWSTRLAGIHIHSASHCNITHNKVMNSGCGIWLYDSGYNQIVGNNLTDNSNGILLESSSGNNFKDNYIKNSYYGISFSSSGNSTLRNNSLNNNGYNFHFGDLTFRSSFDNDIDESNTANGKPMIFWVNKHNSVVTQNVGDVILINCTAIAIHYSDPSHKLERIIFTNTNDSKIIGNTNANINLVNSYNNTVVDNISDISLRTSSGNSILDNFGDISLANSSHNNTIVGNCGKIELLGICSFNTIERNNCSKHVHNAGITINGPSNHNSIIGNTISNNEYSGILLGSGANFTTIIGNNIVGNGFPGVPQIGFGLFGIEIIEAQNTRIIGNNITGNNIGILSGGSDNIYYYNNFINNIPQIRDNEVTQTFDNGYPCGGNYWSNYAGTDLYTGVYQNETGEDGIGDSPFVLSDYNTDNYPLIAPIKRFDAGMWEWTNYNVHVISNTAVTDFSFNPEDTLLGFNVEGGDESTGFCRVTVPKGLLYAEGNWTVLVDEVPVTPTVNEDASNTYLYFAYNHSNKTVKIIGTDAIPEFPSWAPLLIMLVAVMAVAVIYRRRFHSQQKKEVK